NEPEFDTVGELMDFRQVFEDLQFMHNLNIAQNDAKDTNIMINWSPIHDVLIHGASVDMKADWSGPAKPRRLTTQVKYYRLELIRTVCSRTGVTVTYKLLGMV
ncbi:hypothetical protein F5879DRAFT_798327, partial [Lentinula edodes]